MVSNSSGTLRWDDLQFVISVARAGSYYRASDQLHTNASTVARRIQRLEASLGTKIFDRLSHGMQLTPAGRILLDRALEMETVVQQIGTHLAGLDTQPAGTVKIAATEGVASYWLTPRIARFCERYPNIDVEIITNRDYKDFLTHDADIALALGRPTEPRLVVSRVATTSLVLFASENYVRRLGVPTDKASLAQHEFIDYGAYNSNLEVRDLLRRTLDDQRVRLRTNSATIYLEAIKAGIGIGMLPRFYKLTTPNLVEFDIDIGCNSEIWLVSHEETNKAHRIRLLLAYLDEEFRNDRAFWF